MLVFMFTGGDGRGRVCLLMGYGELKLTCSHSKWERHFWALSRTRDRRQNAETGRGGVRPKATSMGSGFPSAPFTVEGNWKPADLEGLHQQCLAQARGWERTENSLELIVLSWPSCVRAT